MMTEDCNKAIFSYLRDFQYPSVLCGILSNCRHHVSFKREAKVASAVRGDDRSKYCQNIRVIEGGKRYVILSFFCVYLPKRV